MGIAGAISILGAVFGVFATSSLRVSDHLFLPREADKNIVILAIDDASLAKIGRWPWSRDVHARLIRKLTSLEVKAIGYDINFPEASNPDHDADLVDALLAAGNVILPIELNTYLQGGQLRFTSASSIRSIATIQTAATAVGHTNIPLDRDNVARRVPLTVQSEDGSTVDAFAVQVARRADIRITNQQVPSLDRMGHLTIAYPNHPGQAFQVISIADILDDSKNWFALKDKVIFVGATARDLHDVQLVPTSSGEPMPGVEIHASIFDTLVSKTWIQSAPLWLELFFLAVIALILAGLVPFIRPRISVPAVIVLWIVIIVGAFIAFESGWIVDIVWPTLLIVFGSIALLIERWIQTDKQKKEIRNAFNRYVAPSVVDQLIEDPSKLKLGGERRHMTVLFSDLRGFTTLSEGLTPEKLVEVLNSYLHEMTSIVFEEQGVLDKYIGDAVMAFWNAPFDQPDHAMRAVRTAVKMRDKLKEMNKNGTFPAGIELKVGVGMNTGEMVVGNIGADMRFDYTVIGDAVNLSSRTEGLCKEYGVEIIVTENTAKDLGDEVLLRKLDKVAVKGKKEPITIYHVLSLKEQITDEARRRVAKFEEALQAYFDRKFEEAITKAKAYLEIWPEDVAAQNLIKRCEAYHQTPPPAEWDGTYVLTKK